MATADLTAVDAGRMTRAQRAVLPISAEVAQVLAEQHGVCIRPLAMRRIDTTTGRVEIVPVPCDPPARTSAARVRTRPGGYGWPNAARAGTWTPSRSSTEPDPPQRSRN